MTIAESHPLADGEAFVPFKKKKWIPPELTHFESAAQALAFAKSKGTSEEYKTLKEMSDRPDGTVPRRCA